MEDRSSRRVRTLVTQMARALISMMVRSTCSKQRPDTLMQDRSPPARQNPLATHGRTKHSGQTRKSARLNGMSVLPPTADVVGPPRHVRVVPQAEVAQFIRPPQRCEKKVWHAAGVSLIRPNNMGTGSDPDVPPQVTVKVLGYFGET
jgi:hypothetical protein